MKGHRLPYSTLEMMIRKLAEDRFRKVEEIAYLRRELEEHKVLLRSALWELAGTNGAKSRSAFTNDWMADRQKREM